MAIHIKTKTPGSLLNDIKRGIDGGQITTWSYDSDGDFSYVYEQWKGKAWLRPAIKEDELIFNIIGQRSTKLGSLTYAIYHSRFIEVLLKNYDKQFSSVSASALLELGDNIGGV